MATTDELPLLRGLVINDGEKPLNTAHIDTDLKATILEHCKDAASVASTAPSLSDDSLSQDKATATTRSICVIGGGPGGMFFCHNMRKQLEEIARRSNVDNDMEDDAVQFSIQCFEARSQPGGVWRKADGKNTSSDDAVEMYDNLWTNGASHAMEFYDFTYDEFFKQKAEQRAQQQQHMTVYMPRQTVLEYITARVTRDCSDFFDQYIQFNTKVLNVEWLENKQHFQVTTHNLKAETTTTQYFDYCIWAGGSNGKQKLPTQLMSKLRQDGFSGTMIHSADTAHLEEQVKGKHVVLVGGEYSAEDLSLQMTKMGVKKVSIVARSTESWCSCVESWPGDKVKIYGGTQVASAKGKTLHLEAMEWEFGESYVVDKECKLNKQKGTIEDVDTVIFCTGYNRADDMLHPSLRAEEVQKEFVVPETWKMPTNALTKILGDVKPGRCLHAGYWHSDLYYGVKMNNPKLMMMESMTDNPILDLDAFAWFFASIVTGAVQLPDVESMTKMNLDRLLLQMECPSHRVDMDENYAKAMDEHYDDDANDDESDGEKEESEFMKAYSECDIEEYMTGIKFLAELMRQAKYPLSLGSLREVNAQGRALVDMSMKSSDHRYVEFAENSKSKDMKDWKTFRDYKNGREFHSILTGTPATNLDKPWLLI